MILVAGGESDPNVVCLLRHLERQNVHHKALCFGAGDPPRIMWRLGDARLQVDGVEIKPTALFLRYDVFSQTQGDRQDNQRRAGRWYYATLAWVLACPHIAFLNRVYGSQHPPKPFVLHLARRFGLTVPDTVVTNDLEFASQLEMDQWIEKPIDGGAYTRVLSGACGSDEKRRGFSAAPALVQRRLVEPDVRVYRVGDRWFAFSLRSQEIDYRRTGDVQIEAITAPDDLVAPLTMLLDHMGLDFGAADFKLCPRTRRFMFLEVNSAPMFVAFDRLISGAIADAIVNWLSVARPARG